MSYFLRSRVVPIKKNTVADILAPVKYTKEKEIHLEKEKNIDSVKIKNILEKHLIYLEEVDADGYCLFQCLSICLKNIDNDLELDKKILMNIARDYISIHRNKLVKLPNDLEISFKDLVEMTHSMDVDTYIKRYSKRSKMNWGGIVEIIAISKIFKVSIYIYSEIENGYMLNYCIEQNIFSEYKEDTIELLLGTSNDEPHYYIIHKH